MGTLKPKKYVGPKEYVRIYQVFVGPEAFSLPLASTPPPPHRPRWARPRMSAALRGSARTVNGWGRGFGVSVVSSLYYVLFGLCKECGPQIP